MQLSASDLLSPMYCKASGPPCFLDFATLTMEKVLKREQEEEIAAASQSVSLPALLCDLGALYSCSSFLSVNCVMTTHACPLTAGSLTVSGTQQIT